MSSGPLNRLIKWQPGLAKTNMTEADRKDSLKAIEAETDQMTKIPAILLLLARWRRDKYRNRKKCPQGPCD